MGNTHSILKDFDWVHEMQLLSKAVLFHKKSSLLKELCPAEIVELTDKDIEMKLIEETIYIPSFGSTQFNIGMYRIYKDETLRKKALELIIQDIIQHEKEVDFMNIYAKDFRGDFKVPNVKSRVELGYQTEFSNIKTIPQVHFENKKEPIQIQDNSTEIENDVPQTTNDDQISQDIVTTPSDYSESDTESSSSSSSDNEKSTIYRFEETDTEKEK